MTGTPEEVATTPEPEPPRERRDIAPIVAATVGALAGGLAFLVAALFLGPPVAVVAGLAAALLAWRRHGPKVAIAFAAAGILAATALLIAVVPLLIGSLLFAAGLLFAVAGRASRAADDQSR